MQVARLSHAVGGVGEGDAAGRAAEASETELAGQQIGAEEAQRTRREELAVVTDERPTVPGAKNAAGP